MQPLKSLTFVRIGDANSHKYVVNKKLLRAFKTLCRNIDKCLKEFDCDYNILDWKNDVYDKDWSYIKGIEYYKGQVASKELIDYKELQEAHIGVWTRRNKDLYKSFDKFYRSCNFNAQSYHSPPQKRGLYAFPQYRLETFLTHWDDSKFDIKHCNVGKDNESYRRRAKKYITIKYNKLTLWCHFIDEAKELRVDIRVSKYWVLVNSSDYLKILALWEKKRLKQLRNDMGKFTVNIKHCYKYISKDDLEVFLVGV